MTTQAKLTDLFKVTDRIKEDFKKNDLVIFEDLGTRCHGIYARNFCQTGDISWFFKEGKIFRQVATLEPILILDGIAGFDIERDVGKATFKITIEKSIQESITLTIYLEMGECDPL